MTEKSRTILSMLKPGKQKTGSSLRSAVGSTVGSTVGSAVGSAGPWTVRFTAVTLQQVDEELRNRDIEDLKFLLTDHVSAARLDKCVRGVDVFTELQAQGLISHNNGTFLAELLIYLGKLKLVRQLGPDPRAFKQVLDTYGGKLSPYRVLLWKYCEQVGKQEFATMKHLARDYGISHQALEDVNNMTDLVKVLESREVLSHYNTVVLADMAAVIKRHDLIDLVYNHQLNPNLPPNYQAGGVGIDAHPSLTSPQPSLPVTPVGAPQLYIPSGAYPSGVCPPPYSPHPSLEEETLSGAGAVHNFYREKQETEMLRAMPVEFMQNLPPPCMTEMDLPSYNMSSRPRGYAVIINNRDFYHVESDPTSRKFGDREGTEVDVKNLEYIWKKLNFEVKTYTNLTDGEIIRLMIEYGTTPENTAGNNKCHKEKDCFVCCILSHGTIGGVYGVNGKLVPIKDITNNFKGLICPDLVDKPKLFFIQACMGTDKQKGADIQTDSAEDSIETIPNEADFLLGFSTTPGFVSYRSREHGSWYVTKLVQMLDRFADRYDLLSILVKVNEEVGKAVAQVENSSYKQSPAPLVTLRKRVIFR